MKLRAAVDGGGWLTDSIRKDCDLLLPDFVSPGPNVLLTKATTIEIFRLP